ncbi:prophenol oxidase activating enzyme precursor [Brachionus plicatilis]|uniref:Prophenol oxidase activating enzyme n=1 Tax=Brachionus plicatilis TaxID=10195 RepID=A0A3M7RCU2_BRAPC|nr:prophenol oxidase activating enzyme precursor [Brachionus plicatilis]
MYYVCSGTLISTKHVLTAARCIKSIPKGGLLTVSPGSHFLSEAKQAKNQIKVLLVNLRKNNHLKENDIALLKLSRSVKLSKKVQTVCLPNLMDIGLVYGKNLVLTGWGSSNGKREMTAYSNGLKQTSIKLWNFFNSSLCQGLDLKLYCGLGTASSNACFGDSGSGLMFNFDNRWYLYGVTSFGIRKPAANAVACDKNSPSFYTIIPKHLDWILSKISTSKVPFKTKKYSIPSKKIKFAGLI